jgi:nitrate/TMAO reductase-like tetraheme cytochrome c subunit
MTSRSNGVLKFPKPVHSKTQKRKKKAEKGEWTSWVRERVFERDNNQCRVCHKRAEEMHEIVFRSLGGLVSLNNSIAVCRECHVKLQRHILDVNGDNANGDLEFVPHVSRWSKI